MGSVLAEKLLTVKAGNMQVLMLPGLPLPISYCRTVVLEAAKWYRRYQICLVFTICDQGDCSKGGGKIIV